MYIQTYESQPISYEYGVEGYELEDREFIAPFFTPDSPYGTTIKDVRSVWAHDGSVYLLTNLYLRGFPGVVNYNPTVIYQFDGRSGELQQVHGAPDFNRYQGPLDNFFQFVYQDEAGGLYQSSATTVSFWRLDPLTFQVTDASVHYLQTFTDGELTGQNALDGALLDFGRDIVVLPVAGITNPASVGVFQFSTKQLLRKIPVAGVPLISRAERNGNGHSISDIGVTTRYNYLTGQVYGVGRLITSPNASTSGFTVAYGYDNYYHRILKAEKTPDNANGTSTVVVKGYYPVPQAASIYQPIANKVPQTGQGVKVFSRAIGDTGETLAAQPVVFSGVGPARLAPASTQTNAIGFCNTLMSSETPGEEVVTATLIVPDTI